MELKFLKEPFHKNIKAGGMFFNECALHRVFDKDQVIGEFIHSPMKSYIKYESKEFKIVTRRPFFFSKTYLVNLESKEIVGRYSWPNWELFKNYIAKLSIGDVKYLFNKLRPKSIIDVVKKTNHVYELANNNTYIRYEFNVKSPAINFGLNDSHIRFEGKIESDCNDKLLVMAGLFLIENDLSESWV